jgi:hypothetical protein
MYRRVIKVAFLMDRAFSPPPESGDVARREPEFIVDGWAYFAINDLDIPGPTHTADATFGPAGSTTDLAGLVWEVGNHPQVKSQHTDHGLMIYVTIAIPVKEWSDLQRQLLALMPAIKDAWSKAHEAL